MKIVIVILSGIALLGLIIFFSFSCISCQTTKNTGNNGITFLINLMENTNYHNKYIFVDDYVPSVMKRKGFDYADSYKTSSATDNYFLFEDRAINRKNGPLYGRKFDFRCSYIDDKGNFIDLEIVE
ncbi:MAG: hypothetical protein FWF73_07790 [Spirochaetes bacterium]|nr:hypothetical protein [Spirochaetota bacterium]